VEEEVLSCALTTYWHRERFPCTQVYIRAGIKQIMHIDFKLEHLLTMSCKMAKTSTTAKQSIFMISRMILVNTKTAFKILEQISFSGLSAVTHIPLV